MTMTTLLIICLAIAVIVAVAGFYLGKRVGALEALESEQESVAALRSELEECKIKSAKLEAAVNQGAEQKSWLEQGEHAFKELAEKALSEQRDALTMRGKQTFGETLKPFQDQLKNFQERINELDKSTSTGHATLKEIITALTEKTNTVSHEASELTKALKGDSQKRGAWGEIQLQRMLEMSGFIEGVSFVTQQSMQQEDDDGQQRRLRPDVVIKLPDERDMVIDAKLTLNDWIEASQTEDDTQRKAAEQRFLKAVEAQIKELSGKAYESLPDIRSLDFTIMYMPIEAAFAFVQQAKPELQQMAMEQRIAIVSPTTLLPILRTIEQIWRIDKQNRNTQEIVRHAGKFYDKIAVFLTSMESINKSLTSAQGHYDKALTHLTSDRVGLMRIARKLEEFGVSHKKQLPARFQDADEDEDEPTEEQET